jgi:hypothetical protein
MKFVNTNGYIEYGNPVSVIFDNYLYPRTSMTKSLFANNSMVYYKNNSLSTGSGGSGVRNSSVKSRRV